MKVINLARNVDATETASDSQALEDVFARHQRELLGTLYYLVGNIEDARDALQDAFVKCWRHRQNVAEIRNLKAWVFRITLNTGRDLRQTAWRRKRESLPPDSDSLVSPANSPVENVERQEEIARVREAIRQLREEEQVVFLLRQNGQLTYEEIAETIGIPTGTVKTRMRLALHRIRETLAVDA